MPDTATSKRVLVLATTLVAPVLAALSHSNGSPAMTNQLDGAWELVSGQPLPKGARDIKILSGGHFIFAAYDTETGKPLYAAGGTYVLNGSSYTEHMDFADDKISAGLIGRDSPSPSRSMETRSRRQALFQMESVCRNGGSG
jgi:hypothetical protein